ncbi:LOW QUALITY PROTEIN: noggin-1 [Lepeophtheirus salmonis]|uniref:LOW QUALITY PROTEIN: noggin-1 n=1 Tax=Lepeophtheirus salmonis TaxID=72036 RepID=UPI001AE3CEEC|nr:LOW QUALITY PROTEIN: noggin-1-like [Lepeophtheirus salmonis]
MDLSKVLYLSFLLSLYLCVSPSVCNPRRRRKDKEDTGPLQRAITYTNPLVPLEFWEKAKRKPRRKHLKIDLLLRKMGQDFDSSWMSASKPQKDLKSVVEISDDQVAELVEQVSDLNLKEDLSNILSISPFNNESEKDDDTKTRDDDGEPRIKEEIVSSKDITQMANLLQQWLIKKSSCPVTYKWKDLGEYFWPRWIRMGSCTQEKKDLLIKKPNCSWPKGLHCVPGEALTLQILRWHCKRRRPHIGSSKRDRPMKCKWYKVPYPVTSSCKCDCKSKKHF